MVSKHKPANYRGKTNKIPLRDKLQKEEREKQLQIYEREARLKANRMLAERQNKERLEKERQQKLKNGANSNAAEDYVTLTRDQLQTILDSLTQVQSGSSKSNLNVQFGKFGFCIMCSGNPKSYLITEIACVVHVIVIIRYNI